MLDQWREGVAITTYAGHRVKYSTYNYSNYKLIRCHSNSSHAAAADSLGV